jgi:hypothetical protein
MSLGEGQGEHGIGSEGAVIARGDGLDRLELARDSVPVPVPVPAPAPPRPLAAAGQL